MPIIRNSWLWCRLPHWSCRSWFAVRWWLGVRSAGFSLQPGHYSSLTAPHLQHTVNQERHDQCGKQHHTRSVPEVMRMILKKILNIHAITVLSLQNRLLVIEYNDSSVAATLHSSGGSLHLRCFSKPSSQLPGHFQLSQNDVLWGGFWAWGIKRNNTERSQGCTVGGEVLWYFEPKIPTHRTNSSEPVSHKFFSCAGHP